MGHAPKKGTGGTLKNLKGRTEWAGGGGGWGASATDRHELLALAGGWTGGGPHGKSHCNRALSHHVEGERGAARCGPGCRPC